VIDAIKQQAERSLRESVHGHEPRARLGKKLAELCPGDIDAFFFTNGGAERTRTRSRCPPVHRTPQGARALPQLPGGTAGAMTSPEIAALAAEHGIRA